MTDLAEFLLARIAEDEANAPVSYPTQWRPKGSNGPWSTATESIPVGVLMEFRADISTLAVDRRVLAECEARRRIVELHVIGGSLRGPETDSKFYTCELCGPNDWPLHKVDGRWVDVPEPGGDFWPCETLRLLGLPYADHPDYREQWRS